MTTRTPGTHKKDSITLTSPIVDGCAQKQCQPEEGGSSTSEEGPKEESKREPEEVIQETNAMPLIHVSVMENDNSTTEVKGIDVPCSSSVSVSEMLVQVCCVFGLDDYEWDVKFNNVDVICAGALKLNELGVFALRLVPKPGCNPFGDSSGETEKIEIAELKQEVIDMGSISLEETASQYAAAGLPQTSFDFTDLQDPSHHK